MQFCKSSVFFVVVIVFALAFASCSKCPILGKMWGSKPTGSSLEISDIRIGTGENDISNGTIVFSPNEKIIITFNVKNMTTLAEKGPKDESMDYYWLREDLIVRDKNGGVVLLQPSMIDGKEPLFAKPLKFKNSFTLSGIEGVKPEKYSVTMIATDLIGFQTATTTIPIKIKKQ
ncbi:MAG: hypothetical protein NT145_02805 [Elusimicrobia bacterium]|nr:hypothetical protein [Elusimicrobiota bacterium]